MINVFIGLVICGYSLYLIIKRIKAYRQAKKNGQLVSCSGCLECALGQSCRKRQTKV